MLDTVHYQLIQYRYILYIYIYYFEVTQVEVLRSDNHSQDGWLTKDSQSVARQSCSGSFDGTEAQALNPPHGQVSHILKLTVTWRALREESILCDTQRFCVCVRDLFFIVCYEKCWAKMLHVNIFLHFHKRCQGQYSFNLY